MAATPRGGVDSGFTGVSTGEVDVHDGFDTGEPVEQPGKYDGLGPILEDPDVEVFKDTEDLIRRQEPLALNHWNEDEYYKTVVKGYPWATLTHDTTRDVYAFELPYGVSDLSIQPVPNKNLDLVNKASEQILVDFPEVDVEALDDSEEAEQAAEMADRFLAQDGGEQGTNDAVLFDDRVKLALVTATSYIEYWVDPSGGGYVPLQIEAHPLAENPDEPLLGPDGMPTTDLILRYVTAPTGGQFTNDPSQAAPQWQPKIRASMWERQHWRVFPEHLPVNLAGQLIGLLHCTIGEAKTRWESVANMAPEDLTALCDWTPPRYLALLPPFQRMRWKIDANNAKAKNKAGASDERLMFYYQRYIKACPEYPKGADVVMSGVDGGTILDKQLLSVEVDVRKAQSETVKETRCRELPVVGVTPRGDPYGQDPTGKCYLSLFVGATEANATLGQGYASALHKKLHTPFTSSSLSPITGDMVKDARVTENVLQVIRETDIPKPMEAPVLDTSYFQMYTQSDEAINSIANRERASSGADNSKERSGKALQIAVSQNNIGNSSMLTAVNNAVARGGRIKIELMMSKCTTTQQVGYVGEDGANKMMDLHATDFALVGKCSIKAGTGTGLSQDGKVQYLGNLKAGEFITMDEAKDAARPSFAKRLGLPPNPFEQYVSRCIDTWLEGPPEAPIDPNTGQPAQPSDWATEYRTWKQADDAFKQATAAYQQQQEAYTQAQQNTAIAAGGPPPALLGPEQQNETAMVAYQTASLALKTNPLGPPPVAPVPPQIPKPWVPFVIRPNDTMPELSSIWTRKMSRTMSTVKYGQFMDTSPEWTDCYNQHFNAMRQASALANTTPGMQAQAHAQPQPQQSGAHPSTPATKPSQPAQSSQPTTPQPALPAGAR